MKNPPMWSLPSFVVSALTGKRPGAGGAARPASGDGSDASPMTLSAEEAAETHTAGLFAQHFAGDTRTSTGVVEKDYFEKFVARLDRNRELVKQGYWMKQLELQQSEDNSGH